LVLLDVVLRLVQLALEATAQFGAARGRPFAGLVLALVSLHAAPSGIKKAGRLLPGFLAATII
jgi:hypothetical protein